LLERQPATRNDPHRHLPALSGQRDAAAHRQAMDTTEQCDQKNAHERGNIHLFDALLIWAKVIDLLTGIPCISRNSRYRNNPISAWSPL
jgi:hypothetical protein